MARGPKKHLKRVAAPSHWMLDKLTGLYAPRPSQGPHKLRECVPLAVLLRNRLKYALTYSEVKFILHQRLVKVDAKVRTDHTFPTGFMDVIEIEKTGETFRMLLDTKGRFVPHRITKDESEFKLLRVKSVALGKNGVPQAITHDGRTIRYVHPDVQSNDTLKFNLENGKVEEYFKFSVGQTAIINGGHNIGRIGRIISREAHPGSFEIVHIEDAAGSRFSTRLTNVFVIGNGDEASISLPKQKGIRLSNDEDRTLRLKKTA